MCFWQINDDEIKSGVIADLTEADDYSRSLSSIFSNGNPLSSLPQGRRSLEAAVPTLPRLDSLFGINLIGNMNMQLDE